MMTLKDTIIPKTDRKSSKKADGSSSVQPVSSIVSDNDVSKPQTVMSHNQDPSQTGHSVNTLSSCPISAIKMDLIEPDPNQPRKFFSRDSLEQLKQSISSTTLIEPILVRENEAQQGRYLIVDGERRWRSCKELEFDAIECRILTKDSVDYELVSFSQNIHREDFTAMEK
jgi:hypothetical protein